MSKYLLGLDIGTTTISWSVLEKSTGKQVEASNTPNDSVVASGVQDPERILALCIGVVASVQQRYKDLRSIGITGQMHGIVILDKVGNSLSPLYTWQYPADSKHCSQIFNITGRNAYPGYGLVTLYILLSEGTLPSEATAICSIMDYVAMKLCGNKRPVIHTSVASSFGLFDLEANSFDLDACCRLGIDCSLLPEVTDKSISIGIHGPSLIFIPIGDNQASFLGATLDQESTLCINCGTGSQVSVAVDDWKGYTCQEVRPYIDGQYILTGSALCGGKAYAMLEKFFREFLIAAEMEDSMVYSVMDSMVGEEESGLLVDTRFCGTRDNPEIMGSVLGITELNLKPGNLIRGFLEGMAQELFDLYSHMNYSEISRIIGSGNGIRKNAAFVRILSKKFGMDLEISQTKEEAAYGASLFAGSHS